MTNSELPRQIAKDARPIPGGLVRLGPPAKGDTIHRTECRYATRSNALRWFWGEEHSEWVDVPWFKHCGVCHPEEREGSGAS